ncbi:Gp49 family protein [Variovorax sp. 278MFTsu5.1]|uniref:Gp49 family protein n=1 Tax=Variovorax sp. 278MFTsu5.1 TaxID=3158366 RepID=UPI003AACF0BC
MSNDRISSQDAADEAQIASKGLNAPRVTPADIEAAIVSESYFTAADGVRAASESKPGASLLPEYVTFNKSPLSCVTICVLVLRNGTKIVGVNTGPVSSDNFCADLGRQYARQHAVDQVWPLLGYALRDQLAAVRQLETRAYADGTTATGVPPLPVASPAKRDMKFGEALDHLISGGRIQRAGWNGKGMFLWLNLGSHDEHEQAAAIGGVPRALFMLGDDGTVTRMPNINMRAADGSTVTGWLASQTDMLACDWRVA